MSKGWNDWCESQKPKVDPNDRKKMRVWLRQPMRKNPDGTPAYRTQQSDKDKADINKIIGRFDAKGMMRLQDQITFDEEALIDVTAMDYHQAKTLQVRVEQEFDQLPSAVRNQFDNDPEKYVAFLNRPTEAKDDISKGETSTEVEIKEEAPVEPIE